MAENGERSTAIERRRDLDGLSLPQRRLLQELALTPDPQLACDKAEVRFAIFKGWLQRDKEFGDAYDELLGRTLEIAKELVESSAIRASGVYEEALTALKFSTTDVTCPGCNEKFQIESSRPDWGTRMKAANAISKIAGLIVDRHQIEKTTIHVTVEEQLHILALKAHQRIPPSVYARLAERGLLPEGHTSGGQDESE